MSEFYADRNFLDIRSLYGKYYRIVNDLFGKETDVRSQISSLRRYSGFGIENQIRNLEKCLDQIKRCREDTDEEYSTIFAIVSEINNCEKAAVNIIGSGESFDSDDLRQYNNIHESIYSTDLSEFKRGERIPEEILNILQLLKIAPFMYDSLIKYGLLPLGFTGSGNGADAVKEFLESFYDMTGTVKTGIGLVKNVSDFIGKKLNSFEKFGGLLGDVKNLLGGVSILKYFTDTYEKFSDLNINTSELLGLIKDSGSTFTTFAHIVETVCDVDIFAKTPDDVADTLTAFGDVHWGDIMPWFTFGETVISSVSGWHDKYNEYAADGEVTLGEMCRTACYGSIEGLTSILKGIKGIGAVLGIVDIASDTEDMSASITDSIFDSIDYESHKIGDMMCDMIRTDPEFYERFRNASDLERQCIYYSLFAQDVFKNAGDAVQTGWNNVCNAASEGWDFVADNVSEGWDFVTEQASNFADNVSDAVDSIRDTVSGWFNW